MPSQTFLNLKPDKKNKIIEAAIEELSQHPYEYINLANIIRDAEIPRGSFYQYFKDKDDLYRYFYGYIGERKMSYFKDLFDPTLDLPFIDRFNQLYLKGFEFAQAYPKLTQIGQKMLASPYYLNDPMVQKGKEQVIEMYTTWLKIDQEKGRIRQNLDARLISTMLFEFMNKITLDSKLNDFESIKDAVHMLTDILKKGIEVHV